MRITLPWSYTYKEYQVEGFIEQIISDGVDDPLYQESEAYERQMEATIAFNSRDRLHRISCPTLVMCGEDDVMTPMRFGRSLTERIEGSRLVTIGGTGHAFRRTRVAETAALLGAFFSEVRRQPAKSAQLVRRGGAGSNHMSGHPPPPQRWTSCFQEWLQGVVRKRPIWSRNGHQRQFAPAPQRWIPAFAGMVAVRGGSLPPRPLTTPATL